MAGVPQSTLNWLYDVLNQLNYRDPNRAYSDLAQTLAQYPGLPPRSTVYTSENGSSALLVNLKGTLPVNFRGTVYRFPLTIWLPQAYPLEAPLVYVTPTEEMVVRQGQHVSGADGKVYHQYLAEWGRYSGRSNVVEFLRILEDLFSREPPVMARPQNALPQRPPQSSPASASGTPQPQEMQSGYRPSSQYRAAPPPPPKSQPGPPPRIDSVTSPPPPAPKPGRYDAPPPLPGQNHSQNPRPQSTYGNGHVQMPGSLSHVAQTQTYQQTTIQSPAQQYTPQHKPGSGPGPYPIPLQDQGQQARQQLPPGVPQHQAHNYQQAYQPQPQPQQYINQAGSRNYNQQPTHQQQLQSIPQQQQPPPPKQPQRDLLSEEDPFQLSLPTTQANIPAPSIPPNPEKKAMLAHLSNQILHHLHQSIEQTNTAAIPSLQAQHSALQTAQNNLNHEINQLQTLSAHLTSNITALTQTLNEANKTISSTHDPKHASNSSNIPSIDEIIIPPSVIARQLYDNVAEQRGYEGAIYALNEAFVRGRVSSDLWSRKVRECAREEFRRKWMVRRIGEGLGLEGLSA